MNHCAETNTDGGHSSNPSRQCAFGDSPTARRSADLESAVSPICNRQARQVPGALEYSNALQNAILRYGRLQICATLKGRRRAQVSAGFSPDRVSRPCPHAGAAHETPSLLSATRLLAIGALILFSAGCAIVPKHRPVLKSEFIFETAPFPSCHASTIAETKSGLVAAWFGGTAERNPDVGIWLSRFERDHWTAPVEVANGTGFATNRFPTWNPVLFQPKTGPLMLFYKVGPSPSTWWGMMMTSEDGGRTWSSPHRLPNDILGPIKNKPVQLPNGDILCGSSTEGEGGWRVHFERTGDLGQTWQATPPVNDGQTIRAIQPSILFYSGGRLQAVGRTGQDRLFEIWSFDGGKTWGRMTLTDLPNPSSGTDAVTLKDGRQLLVYNHNIRTGSNNKGRSPLNVAVSPDGRQWFAALVLEDDPNAPNGFAYPAVIQTGDGLVHITYTWERKRIKHVVLDPAKLKLRPIIHDQWPK